MSTTNFYRPLTWVTLQRYNRLKERGETAGYGIDFTPAMRAYRASPQRVAVQLRGPENLSSGTSEVHGILATADLNKSEVKELAERLLYLADQLED
jgi:hypothetical protein